MAASLRERRRQQTELDIQRATISLALEQGLDHVTTEAIADRAGISPRTFFNYYPNKEAAVVGHPPDFPDCAREAFVSGQGNLRDDLRILLMSNLQQMETRPDIIRGIGELWKENARVRWMLELGLGQLAPLAQLARKLRPRGHATGCGPRLRARRAARRPWSRALPVVRSAS